MGIAQKNNGWKVKHNVLRSVHDWIFPYYLRIPLVALFLDLNKQGRSSIYMKV